MLAVNAASIPSSRIFQRSYGIGLFYLFPICSILNDPKSRDQSALHNRKHVYDVIKHYKRYETDSALESVFEPADSERWSGRGFLAGLIKGEKDNRWSIYTTVITLVNSG